MIDSVKFRWVMVWLTTICTIILIGIIADAVETPYGLLVGVTALVVGFAIGRSAWLKDEDRNAGERF